MTEEFNPYAPPQSIDEAALPRQAADVEMTRYYATSPLKVVLLSLATLGIYETYWLYKQWKAVRAQTGQALSPFWRAVFDIFFVGRLFTQIRADTQEAGVATTGSTGTLVAVYIVIEIIGRVASRLESNWIWLIGFAAIVPVAILQGEINQYLVRRDPDADRNTRWGAGAIVVVVVGALFWALMLYGLAQPAPAH